MQILKPHVHLKKENATNEYHIHVVTWMDYTRFKADGYEPISTTPVNGIFSVVLKVAEDDSVPNMKMLTPVVHTLTLTGVNLSSSAPFVEVIVINSSDSDTEVGKRKTHQDDADDSSMPGTIRT